MDQIRIESHLIHMRAAMHFTKLGQAGKDMRFSLAEPTELAIAQLLGLAASAGFRFDVIDGRLVTTSPTPDWRLWPTLRACLEEIGTDAIIAYFERTTPDRRSALSAPASLELQG
jgi:hypothetical protein